MHILHFIADCGTLHVRNKIITVGTTVNLQLEPKSVVKRFLDRGFYRWVHITDSGPEVAFRKEVSSSYDRRFSETNYVLSINSVQRKDEGSYKVECWYTSNNAPIYLYSNSVDLKLLEPLVTNQTTTILKTTKSTKGKYFMT